MTDHDTTDTLDTIGAAYERLTGALAPPADAEWLVAARAATLRRRRRVTTGAGASLAVLATAAASFAVAGAVPDAATGRVDLPAASAPAASSDDPSAGPRRDRRQDCGVRVDLIRATGDLPEVLSRIQFPEDGELRVDPDDPGVVYWISGGGRIEFRVELQPGEPARATVERCLGR